MLVLATAIAATLPAATGERLQFADPPAVTRGTVTVTIKRLEDFEDEGLLERTANRGVVIARSA
ncbi:MAG: hypothetical protein ABIZ18_14330 [Caldimonas sp.]